MNSGLFTSHNHIVTGLAPVADAFSGTVYSDVVDLSEYHGLTFLVGWGVGATGTLTLTVEACDDIVPTNVTAVAFRSRRVAATGTNDVPGALTARTSAGFTTTAGSNQKYFLEVDPSAIAATGYRYARLKSVEVVDSPILGYIDIILSDGRYPQATPNSAID